MITPKTQTAIAVLKCIYARDYGTCIKPVSYTHLTLPTKLEV